ncbi:hypothetical protein GCM10027290_21790 [Micromonospora sonneratiae]|uniref:Flagellar biosynthesis protein FlgA n=1 Tax=Micromonospora sonneratiae TaxID=1184706 RepID=A0ABW3YDD4_9ACTN
MMLGSRQRQREPTLRPARWPVLPRGAALLRMTLVAALLALAAGVLYAREPSPSSCPASKPTTGPSGTTPDPASKNSTSENSTSEDPAAAPGRLAVPAGTVGVPVRLAEPAALTIVRPGVRVDLLAVSSAGGGAGGSPEPTLVASRALVLDVLGGAAADGTSALYLALPPEQAQRAVGMPEGVRFMIIVRA